MIFTFNNAASIQFYIKQAKYNEDIIQGKEKL